MAKEKNTSRKENPANFINADKTLVEVKGIVNVAKIYFNVKKFYGEPKDSLETAYKNKGFTFEAKPNLKVNLRDLNANIYFAELSYATEQNKRMDLRKALQNENESEIQKASLKYGLAVFLNRESFKMESFATDVEKRFEHYMKNNPENNDGITFYEKQVEEEIASVEKVYDMLKNTGIANVSEAGTMYLDNMNTFKKIELGKIISGDYAEVSEENLVKAVKIADEKKALSDATYGKKDDDTQEKESKETKTETSKEETPKKEEVEATKEAPKKRSTKSKK